MHVGGDVAVHALAWAASASSTRTRPPRPRPYSAPYAPGDEIDRLHQVGVHRRAQAADVIERRDLDAVDVDARVSLGAEPHTMSCARAERRARHAGQVLHDLERVALRAGDAARLLGADAGLDRLLLDARRAHDDRSSSIPRPSPRPGTSPSAACPVAIVSSVATVISLGCESSTLCVPGGTSMNAKWPSSSVCAVTPSRSLMLDRTRSRAAAS